MRPWDHHPGRRRGRRSAGIGVIGGLAAVLALTGLTLAPAVAQSQQKPQDQKQKGEEKKPKSRTFTNDDLTRMKQAGTLGRDVQVVPSEGTDPELMDKLLAASQQRRTDAAAQQVALAQAQAQVARLEQELSQLKAGQAARQNPLLRGAANNPATGKPPEHLDEDAARGSNQQALSQYQKLIKGKEAQLAKAREAVRKIQAGILPPPPEEEAAPPESKAAPPAKEPTPQK